jgi:hypothetical protein
LLRHNLAVLPDADELLTASLWSDLAQHLVEYGQPPTRCSGDSAHAARKARNERESKILKNVTH